MFKSAFLEMLDMNGNDLQNLEARQHKKCVQSIFLTKKTPRAHTEQEKKALKNAHAYTLFRKRLR